jgi:UDP-2,3-diacylglucosamine pyrophosphatase LpxH
MKKLRLIVSDLHVHTGPRLADGRRNVFEEFLEDDLFAEFLEHYSHGPHEQAEVELICNGDFFNMLEVELGTGRPTEAITEEVARQHTERIVAGHPVLFDALAAFAGRHGKHVTFIVGNHDAALLFPAVQRVLQERISARVEFRTEYGADGVFVTHGHQYEFIHHFDMKNFTRRGPGGVLRLKLPYGALFVIQFLGRFKHQRPYIDKVKPFANYHRWAFFNDHMFWWEMLIGIVRFFFRNRFSRDPYRRREFAVAPWRFLNAMTHKPLLRTADDILRKTNYRIVVFGHSHKLEYVMVGESGEYFNTGSWNEQISLDVATLGRTRVRPYLKIEMVDGVAQGSHHNWIGSHIVTQQLVP